MDEARFVILGKFLMRSSLTSLQVMYAMPRQDETFEVACERIDHMLHGGWSPPEFFSAASETRLAEFAKERERLRALYDAEEANPPGRGQVIAFDFEAAANLKRRGPTR